MELRSRRSVLLLVLVVIFYVLGVKVASLLEIVFLWLPVVFWEFFIHKFLINNLLSSQSLALSLILQFYPEPTTGSVSNSTEIGCTL